MAGQFSGLTPLIISTTQDLSATTNVPMCKFDSVYTLTDAFYIAQTAITTNTTDLLRFRILNGKTTGNATTAANGVVGATGNWVAYTGRTSGTNYTFSANHWMVVRYSETGTVAAGVWSASCWLVQGNV